MTIKKPSLSFWQIWNMNVGFSGDSIQFWAATNSH